MSITDTAEYLTIAQAAELFGVNRRTIVRKLDDGLLPAVKLGTGRTSPVRIPTAALDTFLGRSDATPR